MEITDSLESGSAASHRRGLDRMKKQSDDAAFERYLQEHGRCLGLVIRELRTERSVTQHEVAMQAKVTLRWVQRLENNQLDTNYSLGRLYQVACALGVELYELYKRVGDMAGPPPWLHQKEDSKGR